MGIKNTTPLLKIIGMRTFGQVKHHITEEQHKHIMLSLPHIGQNLMNSGPWKLAGKEGKATN